MKLERWKIIHWILIVVFVVQIAYGYYMVFFSGGPMLPLFGRVNDLSTEAVVVRRLYSIETWLAIFGLVVYLAVTEVLPRRMRDMWRDEVKEDMEEIENGG